MPGELLRWGAGTSSSGEEDPGDPESASTLSGPVGGSPLSRSCGWGGCGEGSERSGDRTLSVQLPVITPVCGGGGGGWLANICGFPRMCSVLLWMVDVGLDEGLMLEERAAGACEGAGGVQPGSLPSSCSGWPHLSCCQVPSPTSFARWVGPSGGRRWLPDTSPQGDSGAGPWGVLGPGQANHCGRSWQGVGAVLQWAACVCACLCVGGGGWGGGAGLQAGLPSLHLCLHCLLGPHCHRAWYISSQHLFLHTKACAC